MTTLSVSCPAGILVRKRPYGCLCRVEQQVIDERRDPRSLASYCLGDYTACSTWRSEKDRIAAQKTSFANDRDQTVFTGE